MLLHYQNIKPSGIYKNFARPLVAAYEGSEAAHYALDQSYEEFERRKNIMCV